MSLAEMMLTAALATFIAAVPLAFRRPASGAVLAVLGAAVAVDVLVTIAPLLGVDALRMRVEGRNALLAVAPVLGLLTWIGAALAIVLWQRRRHLAYLRTLLVVELLWFACYLAFLYGMHVYPTY